MGFRVWGLGFRVWGLGFGVVGCGVWGFRSGESEYTLQPKPSGAFVGERGASAHMGKKDRVSGIGFRA